MGVYSVWELGSFIQGNRYPMRAERAQVLKGLFFPPSRKQLTLKNLQILDDIYVDLSEDTSQSIDPGISREHGRQIEKEFFGTYTIKYD